MHGVVSEALVPMAIGSKLVSREGCSKGSQTTIPIAIGTVLTNFVRRQTCQTPQGSTTGQPAKPATIQHHAARTRQRAKPARAQICALRRRFQHLLPQPRTSPEGRKRNVPVS